MVTKKDSYQLIGIYNLPKKLPDEERLRREKIRHYKINQSEKVKEYHKQHYKIHKKEIKKRQAIHYLNHKDQYSDYQKWYNTGGKEQIAKKKIDPNFEIDRNY